MSAREAKGKSWKLFPLVKVGAEHGGVTIYSRTSMARTPLGP